MLHPTLVTLLFHLAGAPTTSASSEDNEASAPTMARRADALFRAGRFLDAATSFEDLWRETQEPHHLFNAAVARERLGEDAAAYVLLQRFLERRTLTSAERSSGEARLRDLLLRTARLRVTITPATRQGRMILERTDVDAQPVEVDLDVIDVPGERGVFELHVEAGRWRILADVRGAEPTEAEVSTSTGGSSEILLALTPRRVDALIEVGPEEARKAGVTLHLTPEGGGAPIEVREASSINHIAASPGVYQVEARAPGFVPAQLRVDLTDQGVSIPVKLDAEEPVPDLIATDAPPKAPRSWRPLAAGLTAVAGAGLIGGGTWLFVRGNRKREETDDLIQCDPLVAGCGPSSENASLALDNALWRSSGMLLMSSGTGMVIGGALLGGGVKRRALHVEAGLGLGMMAVAVPYLVGAQLCYHRNPPTQSLDKGIGPALGAEFVDQLEKCERGDLLASASLGLGAGLATSALIGLIPWERLSRRGGARRTRLGIGLHRSGAGVTVGGQF